MPENLSRFPLRLNAVMVCSNHTDMDIISSSFTASEQVEIVGETTSIPMLHSLIERNGPDVVLLGFEQIGETELNCIRQVRREFNTIAIVVVSSCAETHPILHCFRTGADEFLPLPIEQNELSELLNRLQTKRVEQNPPAQGEGKILGIAGSRGGCGATVLACNLAVLLAQKHRVVLLDLHTTQADLPLHFDAKPTYSLQDIVERDEALDTTYLNSVVHPHTEHLHLLTQPWDAMPVDPPAETLIALLHVLQTNYDFVILDLGHELDRSRPLLPALEQLILVLEQSVPAICLAKKKMEWLETQGFDSECISLVVNKFGYNQQISFARISKTLETREISTIRYDGKKVTAAINQGIPLQNISRWGKAVRDITKLGKKIAKGTRQSEPKPAVEQTDNFSLPKVRLVEKPVT